MKVFKFSDLSSSPLVVDALYEGGTTKNLASEVISKLLSVSNPEGGKPLSVGNAGGFRYRGPLPAPHLVALTSNAGEPAWPDELDPFTGQLTYFGDNRSPGALHETGRGGNQILADTFARFSDSSEARLTLPVYLYFTRWSGHTQQFRGLVVPGGNGVSTDDQLAAIWRTKDGARFQNYRATFTVLNIPEISREWLSDLLLGHDRIINAPDAYKHWVMTGKRDPLVAENVVKTRTKVEQLPPDAIGQALVAAIHKRFEGKEAHQFEPVALALWGLVSKMPMDAQLTQKSVDGGRDAFGIVRIGPVGDPLGLDFALEAKCYAPNNPVGVKETSRLISRLRRHHFGVVVTTSYIGDQAYREIRADGHPVVLITGRDIAATLQANGIVNVASLHTWIDSLVS